ncbi:MAG: hypothetical protein GX561_08010 [Lentisphaerae bacterium]|jgi:hypothetical protein|nr:hypothetical protein [Lentisphaerota bacterium]
MFSRFSGDIALGTGIPGSHTQNTMKIIVVMEETASLYVLLGFTWGMENSASKIFFPILSP